MSLPFRDEPLLPVEVLSFPFRAEPLLEEGFPLVLGGALSPLPPLPSRVVSPDPFPFVLWAASEAAAAAPLWLVDSGSGLGALPAGGSPFAAHAPCFPFHIFAGSLSRATSFPFCSTFPGSFVSAALLPLCV